MDKTRTSSYSPPSVAFINDLNDTFPPHSQDTECRAFSPGNKSMGSCRASSPSSSSVVSRGTLKSRGSLYSTNDDQSFGSRSGSASFRSTMDRFSDRSCNRFVQGRIDEATNGKLNGSFSNGALLNVNIESLKRRSMTTVIKHSNLPEYMSFPFTNITQPDSAPVGAYEVRSSLAL